MLVEISIFASVALVLSALLTGVVRKHALARGVLDVPNERSSHRVATPRGGGVAIVLTLGIALFSAWLGGRLSLDLLLALGGGGGVVAAVGYIDDRRSLSAPLRLAVHFGAAFWALACMGGLPPLLVGEHLITFGWEGYALGAIGIVWTLNLFNFMDGIDGIAGSEAVFIACGGALLAWAAGASLSIILLCSVFGAACAGFLLWNWPPAKIFMGDAGSGFLGFVVAVLAIASSRENPVALPAWVILGGVFFVDATVTFLRRLARREHVHVAHRSHAYQWLARRWGRHKPVTLLVTAINVLWLLPAALFALQHPRFALWIAAASLLPIALLALLAGAGRRENHTT